MPYKDKEKAREYNLKYKALNREKAKSQWKEYRKNNIEKIKEKNKSYYSDNKKEITIKRKEYHKKYKEENKNRYNSHRRKRYVNDEQYRMKILIRSRFNKVLNLYTKTGKLHSIKKYGIDVREIIEQLGDPPQDGKIYHIDHIFPVSAFDLENPEHIKACWHSDNLQWLEDIQNMSKGDNYDEQLFEKYINEHIGGKI
mgnify:CR=1 FL=1